MFAKRWVQWLGALVMMAGIGAGVGAVLIGQGSPLAGRVVITITVIICHLWLAGGIFARVQVRWVLWLMIFEGVTLLAVLISTLFFGVGFSGVGLAILDLALLMRVGVVVRAYVNEPRLRVLAVIAMTGGDLAWLSQWSWTSGFNGNALAITGIAAITVLFVFGLWLIRAALSGARPVFGVARTLIDEAIRMKIALIFIVVLFMTVPILAVLFNPDTRLQYQVQGFLAWSLTATALLLGLMTIFLSCATICNEIDRHQIYLTITKPISRAEYLLGKWLGIALLDLLLLLVMCGGIYTFARVIQVTRPPRDVQDRAAIEWQVLTARRTIRPALTPVEFDRMNYMGQSVKELREQDQNKPADKRHTNKDWQQIRKAIESRWHTVPHRNPQTYVFRDMGAIRQKAVDARHRRERAQVARLESEASSAVDPQEATRLRQWAKDLAEAMQMRAEAMRLHRAARAEQDKDTADRQREQANMNAVEGTQKMGAVHSEAGNYIGDLFERAPAEVLQLRFKPLVSERPKDELVVLAFQMNGRPYVTEDGQPFHPFSRDHFHVINVPSEFIDSRGVFVLQIANITEAGQPRADGSPGAVTVSFTPGEGLEILVTAGSFEGNLIRSALIMWAALCFLAMQGLAAGTFLGFPVACMLSLLVFVTTMLSGYVDESIYYYGQFPDNYDTPVELASIVWSRFYDNLATGKLWDASKIVVGLIGKAFVTVVPSLSDHNPIPLVTDGRIVSFAKLGAAWAWIGVVSTGVCWVVAWLVFRGRELARVMV